MVKNKKELLTSPFERLKNRQYCSDLMFDKIFPKKYQEHSPRHFTPVKVAIKAAKFLAEESSDKILDIGSGIGKVCCIGATVTNAHFYGVELRSSLSKLSTRISREHKIKNVHFINSDFTKLDFSKFQGVYFFNSFHEYFDESCVLDETSRVSLDMYRKFHADLVKKLNECKSGTRLVTYYTFKNKIPSTFQFLRSDKTKLLKFYVKK